MSFISTTAGKLTIAAIATAVVIALVWWFVYKKPESETLEEYMAMEQDDTAPTDPAPIDTEPAVDFPVQDVAVAAQPYVSDYEIAA